MLKKKILVLAITACFTAAAFFSCKTSTAASGEPGIRVYFKHQADSLLQALSLLDSAVLQKKPVAALQSLFAESRYRYKRIEAPVEYYFQGLTRRINGPALPDIKTEDGQVWPPHGFQVIEQFLYSNYRDSSSLTLSNEIKLLQTDLRFVISNLEAQTISKAHVQEMLQHQLIRIAVLGISGFDAPLSNLSLSEAVASLTGVREWIAAYGDQSFSSPLLAKSIEYIHAHNEFDSFDRMEFLTSYLAPLSEELKQLPAIAVAKDTIAVKPFSGTLNDLLAGKGLNADYYANYAMARSNPSKVELGKKLFADPQLSLSGKLSCQSCHQPGLYFTDGKEKAANFIHGGALLRNTPTLYYASLQSHQFYDLRSVSLEDQADDVMKSGNEFNFSSAAIARKLWSDTSYARLFQKSFGITDSLTGFEVRNALAAYVRSLSPFASRFDEYMRGAKKTLTAEEITGFNLFLGKAKCGTCHFLPVFNGNIPPWFTKSESEIIGVPETVAWENAGIDNDSGRYKINRIQELMFAFKTPTVRNVERTGPYMHNGVYKTLDEVVELYHKGGGAGIGMDLPFQSLPFDSLALDTAEKKAIIAFIRSLTDPQDN